MLHIYVSSITPEAVGKLFPNFEFNLHVVAIELMLTLWKSEPNYRRLLHLHKYYFSFLSSKNTYRQI